jgi:hypothetical protein
MERLDRPLRIAHWNRERQRNFCDIASLVRTASNSICFFKNSSDAGCCRDLNVKCAKQLNLIDKGNSCQEIEPI